MRRVHLTAGVRPVKKRRAHSVRLHLEILEDRVVPSADPTAGLVGYATPLVEVVNSSDTAPMGGPGQPGGFSPQQISQAYGFNQIYFNNGTIKGDGRGQTIAIVDPYSQPNIVHDLAVFDSTYGIAAPPNFTVVNQNGGTTLPTADRTWGMEESLDVEWAHAMAPGANILLVESDSNSWSDLMTAVNYARNRPGVSVVSMSWGSPEWSTERAYDGYFTTPSGHNGITFVAASGDGGSSGAPLYPATSPNVLAVGGTQLGLLNNLNYGSETAWSGSGGGLSAYVGQPGYQKGIVTQTGSQRASPDVAYNAATASPYAVYDSYPYGGWITVAGTSAGAPQWAALLAIANQGRALDGLGTLDGGKQTLPALYKLPGSDFHDITAGSNGAYSAGPGYDQVTGRGSPIANKVVPDLVSYGAPVPPSPSPWIVKPASTSPNPVSGRTASLSVQGNEDSGASGLTYTWWALSGPAGAPLPTYSVNGTNAAQNTTVTFYKAGTYVLRVTIADPNGKTISSDVTVTVWQTLTSVAITPANPNVADGGTQQFTAVPRDQFGNAMSPQAANWTWKLTSGAGSLSSSGLYTAPSSGTGTATVQVSGGGRTASTSLTYGPVPAAPSNLSAAVISSQQVDLSWRDNSSNETGFILQRSTNGGAWSTIATVGANTTAFADKTVRSGTKYSYRVSAYNRFGDSAYSNTAGGITPAVTSGAVTAAAVQPPSVNADALWLKWSHELTQNVFPRRPSLPDAWWQAWGYEPAQDDVGLPIS
jgi:subtilase family serine protease